MIGRGLFANLKRRNAELNEALAESAQSAAVAVELMKAATERTQSISDKAEEHLGSH